jgi:hypothetical protein
MTDTYSNGFDRTTDSHPESARPYPINFSSPNLLITPAMVEEARGLLEAGGSIEDMLRYLRDNGAGAIDSIIALRALLNMSMAEAQQTLHESKTWHDLGRRPRRSAARDEASDPGNVAKEGPAPTQRGDGQPTSSK